MNPVKIAALLLATATPLEIWSGIELAKNEYFIGLPLMLSAIALLYIGTVKFSCSISTNVEEDLKRDYEYIKKVGIDESN